MCTVQVARNIDRTLFTTLATCIYPPGYGYYPEEEEEELETDSGKC